MRKRHTASVAASVICLTILASAVVAADAGSDYRRFFRPVFEPNALIWFGGLLWLVLAIDFRRFWSLRTLDVLAIAALPMMFPFRDDRNPAALLHAEFSYAFLAWFGIFAVCGYFFLRCLGQLLRRTPGETPGPGIGNAAWCLLAFAAVMGLCTIPAADPVHAAERAAQGGRYLRDTGHMPYGDLVPGQAGGPLTYALYARMLAAPPATRPDTQAVAGHAARPAEDSAAAMQAQKARLTAKYAHLALLAGIVALGWQFHSARMGALLAGLFGLLAVVVDQLATPAVTVPAAVLAWAVVATAPRWGSLGAAASGILLAAASGFTFYPAMLAPAWLGYYLRRGAHADTESTAVPPAGPIRRTTFFGAPAFALAFLLGVGIIGAYTLRRTLPVSPGSDGPRLAASASSARWTHELTVVDGQWRLSAITGTTCPADGPKCRLDSVLCWLAADGDRSAPPTITPELVRDVPAEAWAQVGLAQPASALPAGTSVGFESIRPANADAARAMAIAYRYAAARYPAWRRGVAGARTILESTWCECSPGGPAPGAEAGTPVQRSGEGSAWAEWVRRQSDGLPPAETPVAMPSDVQARIAWIRQAHREALVGYAGLAMVLFFVFLLLPSRCTAWHLCAVSASILLGAEILRMNGGGSIVAWYLPLVIPAILAGRPAASEPLTPA